jgi:hypothetical protein
MLRGPNVTRRAQQVTVNWLWRVHTGGVVRAGPAALSLLQEGESSYLSQRQVLVSEAVTCLRGS